MLFIPIDKTERFSGDHDILSYFYRLPPAILEKGGTYEQKIKEAEPEEAGRGKEEVSCSKPELQIFAFYYGVQQQEGAAGTL